MLPVKIRQGQPADCAAISALGTAAYPENCYESTDSVLSKLCGYPEGCYVADLDGVVGYLLSFPYLLGKTYPLNVRYEPVETPDCYYIHDVCVAPEFRGKGIARQLVQVILAKKWPVIGLVAIGPASKFWRKQGFLGFAALDYLDGKAEYMLRIAA